MFTKRFILLFLILVLQGNLLASDTPQKAYEALKIFDYFKARTLFYKSYFRHPSAASAYGLALIFSRNDNPFHNPDSAAKYAQQAMLLLPKQGVTENYSGFVISDSVLTELLNKVSQVCFNRAAQLKQVEAFDFFLRNNFLAPFSLRREAVYLRDELEFNRVQDFNRSDSTKTFLITHPLSGFYAEASLLMDRQLFEEATPNKNAIELCNFLKGNPASKMRNPSLDLLYKIYSQNSDTAGLNYFVHTFPDAPQKREAWKRLFALSVKSYSDQELIRFLALYPEFPLKTTILKELEYSSLYLIPFKSGEFAGFIDTSARIKIPAQYDSVSFFSEGLAVVSRNDSVWYINKLNESAFAQIYEEALLFHSGAAAVKNGSVWNFINRQGQVISPDYEEINELSDGLYVVKTAGKYGVLNEFGQTQFEARFDYLSNFVNGCAIYREFEKCGFVTKEGNMHKAEFDWIGDFENNGTAIYKKAGHFGLINNRGTVILNAEYDQVLRLTEEIFLLVNNNLYGFFHVSGCFLSPLQYDFQKEKPLEYYTRNNWLRLIKNKSMALMDVNGAIRVNFAVYEDCGFFSNGLMRVRKKSKTGFVDRKLQIAIPLRYDWASDFNDSLALVRTGDKYELIDLNGTSLFKTNSAIQRLGKNSFLVWKDGYQQLLNKKGDVLCDQILQVQRLDSHYLALILKNEEIKLLRDETFVILDTKNPL